MCTAQKVKQSSLPSLANACCFLPLLVETKLSFLFSLPNTCCFLFHTLVKATKLTSVALCPIYGCIRRQGDICIGMAVRLLCVNLPVCSQPSWIRANFGEIRKKRKISVRNHKKRAHTMLHIHAHTHS